MINDRNTIWRQGHILPEEASKALNLLHLESPNETLVVIVSHDCDLANVQETYLEVIIGRRIEKPEGNFTHTKNVRKLHIEVKSPEKSVTIELLADKSKLIKEALTNYHPRKDLRIAAKNHDILQRWLAVRYRRSAFPDEFNKRFKSLGLDNQLNKILRPHGSYIPAIFFDIDSGDDIERDNPNDPYVLEIIVLHTTDDNYEEAIAAATQVKHQIEIIFNEKLKTINGIEWQYIELKDCLVISDEALSYRQSTFLKQWRLEHISLKDDPIQPTMEQ